jgi:hypothetical protein
MDDIARESSIQMAKNAHSNGKPYGNHGTAEEGASRIRRLQYEKEREERRETKDDGDRDRSDRRREDNRDDRQDDRRREERERERRQSRRMGSRLSNVSSSAENFEAFENQPQQHTSRSRRGVISVSSQRSRESDRQRKCSPAEQERDRFRREDRERLRMLEEDPTDNLRDQNGHIRSALSFRGDSHSGPRSSNRLYQSEARDSPSRRKDVKKHGKSPKDRTRRSSSGISDPPLWGSDPPADNHPFAQQFQNC